MPIGELLTYAFFYSPTLVAGLLAAILALQAERAWKAFATGFLGTILLAAALAALADRVPALGLSPCPWLYHLTISPLLGLPVGAVCAAWVASRSPPAIRQ
jgi:hypothetical protein